MKLRSRLSTVAERFRRHGRGADCQAGEERDCTAQTGRREQRTQEDAVDGEFFLIYSHITQLCGSLWRRGGAIAPSKSWLASFPKFSRTLDTLWSIDFQKNCAVNGKFSLPARRYASAGISHGPVSVCLCVCLSQVGVLVKWLDGSSWFLAWWLVLTCPTLYFKEIRVSTKIRVLSSGTFS